MEEIYKPDADGPEKVEVYSRENNDMLGDMPEWLIHTGSYIVYGLIVFLIAGTALFKYPDTIRKTITIDDLGSAEWITANQTGMIDRFFVENQSPVQKNDTLGILKNTALLEDVQTFCRVLTKIEWYYRTNDIKYLQDYPFDLIMGEMSSAYEQFTQAVRTCVMYQEFDIYPQKKKYLDEELRILESTGKADAMAVLNVKRELFELDINHRMETAKNLRMLELAYENMVNSLRTWDKKYLIKSHHDGIVVWGGTEAVKAVRSLAPPGVKLIEWGHKLGFCYISDYANHTDEFSALARHIASTKQLLCSSCQTVFIDTDDKTELTLFCKMFLPYLEAAVAKHRNTSIGTRARDTLISYSARLEQAIGIRQISPDVFYGKNCSLIIKDDFELELSPMMCNVLVKRLPRKNIMRTLRNAKGFLQTAGLICDKTDRAELTDLLLCAGVTRVTQAGNMSAYFFGESHDGEYPLSRYTRKVNTEFNN